MFKKPNIHIKSIQTLLIIFVWVLLFAIPVLFNNSQYETDWIRIFRIWEEYSLLFVAFMINHFVLVPYFFLKDRRTLYFILFGVLLMALMGAMVVFHRLGGPEMMMPGGPGPGGPFPGGPMMREPMPGSLMGPGREPFVPGFANMLVISFLVLGFDTGLTFSIKWLESQQKQVELEKENTQNKLAFLKTQVSPHFFLNTLNNIHALIDINTDEAKDAVVKLSRLMSYLLYDSQAEKIELRKETDFVKNYVELMRLRFSGKVEISLDVPDNLPEAEIPPLLFISFIENAFKHGVSYQKPSFIEILFDCDKEHLWFQISNSNHAKAEKEEKSGIGIANSLKRLELIYDNNHILTITDENVFTVKLGIPL